MAHSRNANGKLMLMSAILKPLTCSERVNVFLLLDSEERSIEELAGNEVCKVTMSRHLRVLYSAGLVERSKRGQQAFYRLDRSVARLANELNRILYCISTK